MPITTVLFDLDNTIYPASNGLMKSLDLRIGEYVQQTLGLGEEESLRLRRHYYNTFGTTLRGLRQHHDNIDTESYLQFVHDLALDAFLVSDERLDASLAELPARKVIFTNSPREYAERVLAMIGISHHFERIFDVRYFDFVCKPEPSCYERVLDDLGINGAEALMIEDTAVNLPPAARLGVTTILLAEDIQEGALADYIVPDVLSAVEIAQRLVVSQHDLSSAPGNPSTRRTSKHYDDRQRTPDLQPTTGL